MKQNNDILKDCSELKEMPYSIPDGYFESLKRSMMSVQDQKKSLRSRLYPYLAMAAMFVLLVTGGTFILRNFTPEEEFTQEDFVLFSNTLTNTIYYESISQFADAEIDEEEIIEYLIYSGISAEEIEYTK